MKVYKLDQKSDDWFLLRKGKITGTDLKRLLGGQKAKDTLFYEKIAERLMTGLVGDESAMSRGNRLESEAIKVFEKEMGKIVETFGFCQSDENDSIGYSPDGLIQNNGVYDEGVEVKSLMGTNYIKAWFEDEIPEEYYPQIIQSFIVNPELRIVWFVLYNPQIQIHPIHIVSVYRKAVEEDIEKYKKQEIEFLESIDTRMQKVLQLTF